MEITRVIREDVPAVTSLQNRLLLDKCGYNEGNGFLVSGYTEEDYVLFTDRHEYFFKISDNGNIAGVLMAYESRNIPVEDKNNSLLKYALKRDFVLIKQIFVSPDYAGRGVATELYRHLFSVIPDDCPAVAVVVMQPFNKISCEFHKRRGFSEFLDFIPEPDHDGIVRKHAAWIRPSRRSENFLDDVRLMNVHDGIDDIGQTMSSRLSDLVGLYCHEDNLNWTKIGRQCTILFALIAVLAYFYDKDLPAESWPFLVVIGVGGMLLNIMFLQKVRSGIRYMNTYKRKIQAYDKILTFYYPKVIRIFDDGEFIAKKSVSSKLLVVLAWAGLAIWIVTTVFLKSKMLNVFVYI